MRITMQFYIVISILMTAVVIGVSCDCGIAGSTGSQSGIFPWHVLIYRSDSSGSQNQICAGTLVSSKVVISAALCFYDEESRSQHSANSFTVAAGKRYRPHDWPEDYVQESAVETINLATRYNGYSGNFANNIAWIILQNPFDLTKSLAVAPVCIDFENQYESVELRKGEIGKAVGQSYNAAGYPSDELQETNVPFVPRDECVSQNSEIIITSDKFCAGFLNESKLCSRDIGGGLVFHHNGRWYLRGVVSLSLALGKDCGHGYLRSFTNFGRYIDETKKNTNIRVPVGGDPPKKNLVCGISTIPNADTLIANGEDANLGGFPWHVGIYRKNSTGYYQQICGGSLVSENIVISAAHCFYDDRTKQKLNASRYAVAGGKRYRPYNWLERFVQKSPIEEIHLSSRYHGIDGLYAGDIAWVILKQHFEITAFVKPVCLETSDRQRTEQFLIGKVGKVAGWGVTEEGTESHSLQQIHVPFIPYQECISRLPEDHKPYVTSDKFCAGHLNGIMLCEGDSGGGLVFEHNGRWYLHGIVSVNPRGGVKCERKFYTAFTDVGAFGDEMRSSTGFND